MEKFFKLKERGTNVKTEIIAGVTTFFAMVYILMVNADMFQKVGVSYGAIYIATAISAIVGTVIIGLLSNLPLAQASGMGINAYFVYTVCLGLGFTYANALVMVLIDGVVFIILTLTGLRKLIFDAIPKCVRTAIAGGIGLFIAFLGLQNAGIIQADGVTCVKLASLNLFTGTATWGSIMPLLVTIISLLTICILHHKNVKGSVFIGIVGGAVLYYLLGLTVPDFYANLKIDMMSPLVAFREFADESLFKVFTDGFNFSAFIEKHGSLNFALNLVTSALAFCMVDMFDTLGTLFGACQSGNLLDENGNVPNMNRAMLSDAIATTTGAICGTSTVTTFSEVTAGIAVGGKTGLTSIVTGICFFIAMFLSPIAQLVPSSATAAALIFVGILMMSSIKEIEWNNLDTAVPAFLTMVMMPFTYNISYGIAFGMISYVIMRSFTGKIKEIKVTSWVIVALFIATLLLTH